MIWYLRNCNIKLQLITSHFSACIEAYNETSSRTFACKFGCDAQEVASKQKKVEKEVKIQFFIINLYFASLISEIDTMKLVKQSKNTLGLFQIFFC